MNRYFNFMFAAESYCKTSPTKTIPTPFAMECYASSLEEAEAKIASSLHISVDALRTKKSTITVCDRATTFVH